AMDFPEGKLLSSLLPTAVTPELLCAVGADLADALASLHAQGVVHGELATDSVLLIDGRRAILWDMPLVLLDRLTDRRGGERNLSVLKRKAALLAPEVAQGNAPTPAADVYGIGAVICVASGAQLASGPTTLSVLHQVATGGWHPAIPA